MLIGCGGGMPSPAPPTPPSLPASWQVIDLPPIPGMTDSQANAINNLGDVVGYSTASEAEVHATLWQDGGTPEDLGLGFSNAVNDSRDIVGYREVGEDSTMAVIWPGGGSSQDIGLLTGFDSSVATGINNSGEVVGVAYAFNAPGIEQAFSWTAAGGIQPIQGCATAMAISDEGVIAGTVFTAGDANLDAASCQPLKDLGLEGFAAAVNRSGVMVGNAAGSAEEFPGTAIVADGVAAGINDLGWVVGYQLGSQPLESMTRQRGKWNTATIGNETPFIWTAATGIGTLPGISTAAGINQSGEIAGTGFAADGVSLHALLLKGAP
jgi:probable HAF family extracellular repeat protein